MLVSFLDGNQRSLETFRGASLQGADFRRASLRGADFREADLREADLQGASLQGAGLQGAGLQGAILRGASLRGASLREADLQGADLRGADLQWGGLRGADLRGADLREADLREADLREADLREVLVNYLTAGYFNIPQKVPLYGWKKVRGEIVSLLIPEDAERSCAATRKCRAAAAKVLGISGGLTSIVSDKTYGLPIEYRVGAMVYPDAWDPDRWNECSNGIHFFLTEEEAKAW